MPKIILAAPAVLYLLIVRLKKGWSSYGIFVLGCLIPGAILFLWLFGNNILPLFFHALIHDARMVNIGNVTFSPFTAFTPWPLVYVREGGISIPWVINTILWICSVPGIMLFAKKYHQIGIFLMILAGSTVLFLFAFPKPFLQYFLIPSCVASIAVGYLLSRVLKTPHRIVFASIGVSILCIYSFFLQWQSRQSFGFQNQEQLQVLTDIPKIIQPNESVYDMVGSFIYRPDSYFICCHSYTQFETSLDRPLPTLIESVIQTKTKFLLLDQKGYVFWYPKKEDLDILLTQYLPTQYKKIYSLGSTFHCYDGSCIQYTLHNMPFSNAPTQKITILMEERYKITLDSPQGWVIINNRIYHTAETAVFQPGTYLFEPSSDVTEFTLQLSR